MISVIVPVYNVGVYLNRCIQSIVNQLFTDLEIILVDDGSTDDSGSICDDWSRKDERIKVLHKKNGGLSDARNAGIEIATGDYLGFVDGDDWIENNMYQLLIEIIEKYNANVATSGLKRVYENGFLRMYYVFENPHYISGTEIIQSYLHQNEYSTSACDKLFDAKLFKTRRFPKGRLYEDTPVIFDIICNIERIAILGKPLYNYYQRVDSICGKDFSIYKLDYYYFTREVYQRVVSDYAEYEEDAKDFLGTRICEIIFLIQESNNASCFKKELNKLRKELKDLDIKIIGNGNIPNIMKIKIAFAQLGIERKYIKLKKIIGKRS